MNQKMLATRIDRLKRFIDLDAPAFILAYAYNMALDLAEKLKSSKLEEVQAMGKKLKSTPMFEESLARIVREANLQAAGFCTNIIKLEGESSKTCMQPTLPNERLCAVCNAEFEAEMKADEEYDASPEGQMEIAEWEAAQLDDD